MDDSFRKGEGRGEFTEKNEGTRKTSWEKKTHKENNKMDEVWGVRKKSLRIKKPGVKTIRKLETVCEEILTQET